MTADTGLATLAIEQVLELSADAHIERRMTAQDSAAFHRLTGAIAAYGKALSLLLALEEREEFRPDCASEPGYRAGSLKYVAEELSGV